MPEDSLNNACEVTGYGDVDHVFELAIQGDRAAADQAFAACIARFERVLARFVYNVEDREDALQDGLLNAYRHLSQFQGKSQFTTWIHTIVVNAARSNLRRQLSRPRTCSLDDRISEKEGGITIADTIPDPSTGIDEEYERLEQHEKLARIVRMLPASWRLVIWLRDVEGLAVKEVAERLGLSAAAVKTRHFRASRRISEILKGARGNREYRLDGMGRECSPFDSRGVRTKLQPN